VLVHNLIGSEPDAIVVNFKGKHMVDEWFALRMIFRRVEQLKEKFLHQAHMRPFVKSFIEGEKRSTILEAITCQF